MISRGRLEWAVMAKLRASISKYLYPAIAFWMVIMLWQVSVSAFKVPPYLVPGPWRVAAQLGSNQSLLAIHALETLKAILLGYGLAVLIGILLAVAFVSSKLITKAVYPLVIASQAIPKVAIAPLFVIWFGFGLQSKVLVTFSLCFFPILVNTILGLVSVLPELIGLVRSMGARPLQIFVKIRLPNALPSIFSGLKIAIMSAIVGAIVSEFVGSNEGLGYLLLITRGNLETELLFGILVILSAMGILLYAIVSMIERFCMPWHVSQRAQAS